MSAIHSTYRTAESVSPGHPDKICDQISDAILDAYLAHDQKARVAVEACGGHGTVFLTGEVSSTVHVDPVPIVQRLAGEVEVINRITKLADGMNHGSGTLQFGSGLRRRLPQIRSALILELADRRLRLAIHHEHAVLAVAGLQRIDQIDQHVGRILVGKRAGLAAGSSRQSAG